MDQHETSAKPEVPVEGPFIDESARDQVVVSGPDALSYLHSQVAQDVEVLGVGEMCWTLVLEPSGKVVALARLARNADDLFVLDTDAGYGQVLLDRLRRFMIRVDARLELETASHDDAVASRAPGDDAEVARVALGWPRMGAEIIPGETVPGSTGVMSVAVSFTKGCYPGQELVERMDARGAEAPRSLRVLEVGPDARPGDPVLDGTGATVGELTSVADGAAIASVRRGTTLGSAPPHA